MQIKEGIACELRMKWRRVIKTVSDTVTRANDVVRVSSAVQSAVDVKSKWQTAFGKPRRQLFQLAYVWTGLAYI